LRDVSVRNTTDTDLSIVAAPSSRETLPTGIAAKLRRQIESGELPAGSQLPGHRDLAAQFDVSLSSVREAISMLVSASLVETQAGRGTFVSAASLTRPRVGPPLTRAEVEELVEARIVIEARLARLAAERATAEQVAALGEAVEHMEKASTSPTSYPDADVDFHLAVAAAANNRYLLQSMIDIRELLRDDMELGAEAAIRRFGDLRPSVDSHRRLWEAIADCDPDAAETLTVEIINRNREFVLGLYAIGEKGPS
jgi:GntR family transcriptional repressor for pyruvate dehydrogenase complex